MHAKPYAGKYCKKTGHRKALCRLLYVVHALLLVVAGIRIFSAAQPDAGWDLFVPVGATSVEQPSDTQPPRIVGVENLLVYEGDAVSYRGHVRVEDDQDPEPALTVDSSSVDLTRAGVYTVTYTAEDSAGNRSCETAVVNVLPRKEGYADLQTIFDTADGVLEELLSPDMTARQQVEAIYFWIRGNCSYSGHTPRGDWRQAAYTMLTTGTGDCYGYYSATKLLFERLGIPNIDVTKVKNFEGDSEHYWSLVSVDGGESWYHFDATPRNGQTQEFCLVTDSVLDDYSREHNFSHNRDMRCYPATPEE